MSQKRYRLKVEVCIREKKNDIFLKENKKEYSKVHIELAEYGLVAVILNESFRCYGKRYYYSTSLKKYFIYEGDRILEICNTECFIQKCNKLLEE